MIATKQQRKTKSAPVTENIINDETVVFTDPSVVVEQGDLYFVAIAGLPKSAKPRANRQLADGATQGSRHICTIGNVFDANVSELIKMIRTATGKTIEEQYIGPVFQSVGGRAYIEHPEHGDHDFQCDVTRVTVFQRSLDAEERAARVAD